MLELIEQQERLVVDLEAMTIAFGLAWCWDLASKGHIARWHLSGTWYYWSSPRGEQRIEDTNCCLKILKWRVSIKRSDLTKHLLNARAAKNERMNLVVRFPCPSTSLFLVLLFLLPTLVYFFIVSMAIIDQFSNAFLLMQCFLCYSN